MESARTASTGSTAASARSATKEGAGSFETPEHREPAARFDAFYDFAFSRVYRYAQRRMPNTAQAQTLCRLVLIRAMTSLGGIEMLEHRIQRDETEFAFWLFCLARRTADQLSNQLAEHPELLEESELDGYFEEQALELLRKTLVV